MNNRLSGMLELLITNAELDEMVAYLRDYFLDIEAISEDVGHDILPEVVSDPEHVIYYTAVYIDKLQKLAEGDE